jgi:cytidine deaminase
MHLSTLLFALTTLTTATPLPNPFHLTALNRVDDATTITQSQMETIAPKSTSCDNPPAQGECATGKQAAKFTSQSFDTYKVTNKAEQAAIIALIAFESEDFRYNKNHFPGVAGQGSEYFTYPILFL